MGCTLNAGSEASTEAEVAIGLSSMVTRDGQQTLGQKLPVDFTNAKGADTQLFVKGNKAAGLEGSVGNPRRMCVGKTVGKGSYL